MNTQQTLLRAAHFAAEKHAGQKRKGSKETPYINHPLEVAKLIAEVGSIDDIKVLAAAILHDTVEDTDATHDELVENFGPAVAGLVREVTDDKSLPKAERKRLQIEHAPHLSTGAQTIKLADKICNIRDVTDDPGVDWTLERRQQYIDWAVAVVAGLRGVNERLERMFDQYVERARKLIL